MNYQAITKFFMWNTVINGGLLILWSLIFLTCSDCVYELHGKFFALSRESFNISLYFFIGLFKLMFIVFNLVPFLAALILKKANAKEIR